METTTTAPVTPTGIPAAIARYGVPQPSTWRPQGTIFIPRAKVVRAALWAGGVPPQAIDRITSGRNTAYVRLVFDPELGGNKYTDAAAAALRTLWSDGDSRVTVLLPWLITIDRRYYYDHPVQTGR